MKANPFRFIRSYGCIGAIFICILVFRLFAGNAGGQDISPPCFLTALGDQDGKVPLFWFSPHPDTHCLTGHVEQLLYGMHVVLPWRENCVAVRMISPSVPFHLLKSRIYLTQQGVEGDSTYDVTAPFFVTVNSDSGGTPRNAFLDSVWCSAGGQDGSSQGGWVEITHQLLVQDSIFWVIFHWQDGSPTSPLVGVDQAANTGTSFWGRRTFFHFEWHPFPHNLMIQAVIATDGEFAAGIDSFLVYRSSYPDSLMYHHNLVGTVPGFQRVHTDLGVVVDSGYFYRVTCANSEGEGRASNLAYAVPKTGAVLECDRAEICVHTGAGQPVCENLTLTNSGGLPLTFAAQVDIHQTAWIGGFDPFGYCWTDHSLDPDCHFAWVDIEERGVRVGQSGDDNVDYGFFRLGFSFPFYGDDLDSLRIASDGWMSFSDLLPCYSDTFHCYVNQRLPWLWGPYCLVAPFWDDLKLVDSSAIYFYSNADSAVVSFNNLHRWGHSGGGPYTFQTILTRSGEITFQYLHVPDSLYSATVGTQNRDGTVGLEVHHDHHHLHDSLVIRITPGWIETDSWKGWLQPGESTILSLTFDPLCYPQGIYEADFLIHGWDRNHYLGSKVIPLAFCIDTITSVEWVDTAASRKAFLLQNYPNPFNPVTRIRYAIGNSRTPVYTRLEIYNIMGQKVKTLVDGLKAEGSYLVVWDGKDDRGEEVASGIYLYRLRAGDSSEGRRMLLLK